MRSICVCVVLYPFTRWHSERTRVGSGLFRASFRVLFAEKDTTLGPTIHVSRLSVDLNSLGRKASPAYMAYIERQRRIEGRKKKEKKNKNFICTVMIR